MKTGYIIGKVVDGRVLTVEVYPDRGRYWRWRSKTLNGRIVRCSGESFASCRNAKRAAERWG